MIFGIENFCTIRHHRGKIMGFDALILTHQALEAFFALLCQCHSPIAYRKMRSQVSVVSINRRQPGTH